MKIHNLKGVIATVNENAYDTWLDPYIGYKVEVARTTENNAFLVTDYGNDNFGEAKVPKEYLDF
jgi:hypothetical protein